METDQNHTLQRSSARLEAARASAHAVRGTAGPIAGEHRRVRFGQQHRWMNIRIEEMVSLRHGPRTVQKVHLHVAVTRRIRREHRRVDERRAVRLRKHRRVPARAVVPAGTVVGGRAGAVIIPVPAAHVRTAASGAVGRRAAGSRIGKVHRVARRSRSGRRAAGREPAAVSEGRERDGGTRGLRRRIVAHPPALPHVHLDAVLSLRRLPAAGGRVVRRIQL